MVDAHEQLGQPVVSNGVPLTKLHHAAFDANLIGIDADFRIHVSAHLLEIHDGPFLELGLKTIAGASIQLPRRGGDWPDRNRLALRFEQYKKRRDRELSKVSALFLTADISLIEGGWTAWGRFQNQDRPGRRTSEGSCAAISRSGWLPSLNGPTHFEGYGNCRRRGDARRA